MRKAAYVVLAVSLVLPLMVSRASPPDVAPEVASGPVVILGLEAADLPKPLRPSKELESLSPEELSDVLEASAGWLEVRTRGHKAWRPGGICLAAGDAEADLCATAARISHSRPCLAAGDCPALEDWKEVMGTPGLRPAPRSLTRAAARLPSPEPEQD